MSTEFYKIPGIEKFLPGDQARIRCGEIPDVAEMGAWRQLLENEQPHPRHVVEKNGLALVPARLYGPGEISKPTGESLLEKSVEIELGSQPSHSLTAAS